MDTVVINIAGGVILVGAVFVSLVVGGRMADGDAELARRYIPYLCGAMLIGADLIVRGFYWRKLVLRRRQPLVVTRQGSELPRRRVGAEVGEMLFHPNAGGQYFYVLPTWVLGVALNVAKAAGLLSKIGM